MKDLQKQRMICWHHIFVLLVGFSLTRRAWWLMRKRMFFMKGKFLREEVLRNYSEEKVKESRHHLMDARWEATVCDSSRENKEYRPGEGCSSGFSERGGRASVRPEPRNLKSCSSVCCRLSTQYCFNYHIHCNNE